MKASSNLEQMKITRIERPRFIAIECSQSNAWLLRTNRSLLSALLGRCKKKLLKKDYIEYYDNLSRDSSYIQITIIDKKELTSIYRLDDFPRWYEQKFKKEASK